MSAKHPYEVEDLFGNGAKVDTRDKNGDTALLRSAKSGNSAVMEILLDSGANSGLRDKNGRNALTISAQRADQKSIEILLQERNNSLSSIAQEDLQLLGSDFLK